MTEQFNFKIGPSKRGVFNGSPPDAPGERRFEFGQKVRIKKWPTSEVFVCAVFTQNRDQGERLVSCYSELGSLAAVYESQLEPYLDAKPEHPRLTAADGWRERMVAAAQAHFSGENDESQFGEEMASESFFALLDEVIELSSNPNICCQDINGEYVFVDHNHGETPDGGDSKTTYVFRGKDIALSVASALIAAAREGKTE